MIELLWPAVLALLPLPWLVHRWWPPARSRRAALRAPFHEQWRQLERRGDSPRGARHWPSWLLLALVWLGLLLAASRPVRYGEPVELPRTGRDLLLAVDLSGSMRIDDMARGGERVERLSAVKAVLGDFARRREGDRLGLILFGSAAYLQAPLTFDTHTVGRFLEEARVGFAGNETALGDAIGLAIKRLRLRPERHRVLILLSDGANTAGAVEPLAAARMAAENGIRIYTVGVGADEMTRGGLFGTDFGSRAINPSRDLDERGLEEIAGLTGGRYFRARNPDELEGIYRHLDALEPIEQEARAYRPQTSLLHWPLAVALLGSLLLAALRQSREARA